MRSTCTCTAVVMLVGIFTQQCLRPFDPPPESQAPFSVDTTLNDTGIVDSTTFHNPIIPGFHPDPSICRVGQDYYLVNSSFEYFPGIPIHHSRDLVHWRLIGNCLSRPSQLALAREASSGGVSAPTIRYYNGVFYVIACAGATGGVIYVTARDPAGPWSEPISVVTEGFDPSLFFDDDGKVYYQSQSGADRESHIIQYRIDLATGQFIGPKKILWKGDGDVWLEGPHLYKINGTYYLTAASGGTHWGHHQVVAASNKVFGPYTDCPGNPVLSHRGTQEPIQFTGHADFFEDHNGRWWAVFLGSRHMDVGYSPLCRETFLSPVRWCKGWPVVGDSGRVSLVMKGPLPETCAWETPARRDDFDATTLPPHFISIRNPRPESYSLMARKGWLRLRGNEQTLSDPGSPAFVGRRQQHFDAQVRVKMSFLPTRDGEEAGVSIRLSEMAHYEIARTQRAGAQRIVVRSCTGGTSTLIDSVAFGGNEVYLQITCSHTAYALEWSRDGTSFARIAQLESRPLSMEYIHAFTGVVIGMYATGNGTPCSTPADFDWFEYKAPE